MINPDLLQLVKDYVTPAQTVLIFLPPNASVDQVGSGLALLLGLQTLGKYASLVIPGELKDEFRVLAGADQITAKLGNKDLQITFDYEADLVEKVSYNIDEEARKFNLVIQPKKGRPALDASTIKFSYVGADADIIFVIGASELEALDPVYAEYEALFQSAPIISLNTFETEYGTIKISTEGSGAFAEVVTQILPALGAELNGDIATNLLAGVERSTDGFRSLTTTADTFETASKLLRAGARRISRSSPVSIAKGNGFAEVLATMQKKNGKKPEEKKKQKPIQIPEQRRGEGTSLV